MTTKVLNMAESNSGIHIGKGTIILILLLTSFSIMAAMPATFYLNLGDTAQNLINSDMLEQFMEYLDRLPFFNFNGNLSDFLNNFDFPTDSPINPGNYNIPPGWDIPDFDWGELPEGWQGELPEDLPEDLPDGYQIPDGWLPDGVDPGDYPGLMGLGLSPFGTPYIKVWVNSSLPNRYWRLRTYDTFNSTNWVQSNKTTSPYDYTTKSPIPSSQKYLVWMNITYQKNGSGSLPIPHLWPSGEVISNLTVYSPADVKWNLLKDPSGAVIWNASISNASSSEFIVSLVYNVTYDDSVSPASIYSHMTSQIVDGTPFDPPGNIKYRQLPNLPPDVVADMEKVKNMVFSKSLNVYNASLAVLEYFKTHYSWIASDDSGSQFNASRLVRNGNGTNSDFASNFALYLRYLNISTRLVWGGIGYFKDTQSPTSNDMYSLSPIFYTEVWIPNSTNTGGHWLQMDPTPFPNRTYGMTGPGSYSLIYPRILDDRIVSHHYDLLVLSNPSDYHNPLNHLNRYIDSFSLNATLYRDGTPISQTLLGELVNFTFYDETDDKILGYNWSIHATWTGTFDNDSIVGPHKIHTFFYALDNRSIFILNGTTFIDKDSFSNPSPIYIKRGIENSFLFYANLSDPVSHRPISSEILSANISSQQLINNTPCKTDQTGLAIMNLSVPSTISTGIHNMTVLFNGIFTIENDFPNLPPNYVIVLGAYSISSNHTIIVKADINISLYKNTEFSNNVIVRNNNLTLCGRVIFDNGTAISNAPVDIHWQNSSGEYIFGTFYTNSTGWYSHTLFISSYYTSPVNVWANTTLIYGNKTTSIKNYLIHCQDSTQIHLYPPSTGSFVVRNVDSVFIKGYLIDPLGIASTANQKINLIDNVTGQIITQTQPIITDANGNFSANIQIPIDVPVGYHTIFANFNGTWNAENTLINIPSSGSNSSEYGITVVAKSLLVKNLIQYSIGRNLYPSGFIPIGENLNIYGNLVLDNHTVLSGKTVNAWETFTNGTTIFLGSDITNGSGFYNISYLVPSSHPTGSSIIFVNYSAGNVFSTYMTNASASNDPEFGYLCDLVINSVTPNEALRGQDFITVQGTLNEIYYGTNMAGQKLYITFNSSEVYDKNSQKVMVEVDGTNSFSATFITSNKISEANYTVNATPVSSTIHYNKTITSNIILNASSIVSKVNVLQTPIAGESLNITGKLMYENGSDLAGQIIIYPESNSSKNITLSVYGDYNLSLPIDSSFANKSDNLIVEFKGAPYIRPSSSSTPIYIGNSPTLTIDAPMTAYQNFNFNIYGKVLQNGHPYFNRKILISILNSSNHNNIYNHYVTTDSNGNFILTINLPQTGNFTIIANLSSNVGSFASNQISIQIIQAPNIFQMLWVLWIIIPLIVGIILGYLGVKMAVRKREKKKKQKRIEKIDPNKIKNNLKALCDGDRYKEAIIYAYISFLNVIDIYKGKKRRPSQSIREFAMELVKNMKLPPKNVYSFTSLYEEARFSNHDIDKNKFEEAKLLFDALVSPIIKKTI